MSDQSLLWACSLHSGCSLSRGQTYRGKWMCGGQLAGSQGVTGKRLPSGSVGGPGEGGIETGLVGTAGADGFGHLVIDFGDTPFWLWMSSCFTLHRFLILNEFYPSGSLLPKPTRHLLHQFPMHHAAPPGHHPRHRSSPSGRHQRRVRATVVRSHLDPPSHDPADFTTMVGLVHVPGFAAGLELAPVLAQHVRFDRRGSFSSRQSEQHSRTQSSISVSGICTPMSALIPSPRLAKAASTVIPSHRGIFL